MSRKTSILAALAVCLDAVDVTEPSSSTVAAYVRNASNLATSSSSAASAAAAVQRALLLSMDTTSQQQRHDRVAGAANSSSSDDVAAALLRMSAATAEHRSDDDDGDEDAVVRALAQAPWQSMTHTQPLLTSSLGALVDALATERQQRQQGDDADVDNNDSDDAAAQQPQQPSASLWWLSSSCPAHCHHRGSCHCGDTDTDDASDACVALAQHRRELSALLCVLHRPPAAYAWVTPYAQLLRTLATTRAAATLLAGADTAWRWLCESGRDVHTQRTHAAVRMLVLYTDALALYLTHAAKATAATDMYSSSSRHTAVAASTADVSANSGAGTITTTRQQQQEQPQQQQPLLTSAEVTQCVQLAQAMDAMTWRSCDGVQRCARLLMCVVVMQQQQQQQQQHSACEARVLDGIVDRALHAAQQRQQQQQLPSHNTDSIDDDNISHIAVLLALLDQVTHTASAKRNGTSGERHTLSLERALALVCCTRVYARDVAVHFRGDGVYAPLRTFACTTLASLYRTLWTRLNTSTLWCYMTPATLLSVARSMRLYAPLWAATTTTAAAAADKDDNEEDDELQKSRASGSDDGNDGVATAQVTEAIRALIAYIQQQLWRSDEDTENNDSDENDAAVRRTQPGDAFDQVDDEDEDDDEEQQRRPRGTITMCAGTAQGEAQNVHWLAVYCYAAAALSFVCGAWPDDEDNDENSDADDVGERGATQSKRCKEAAAATTRADGVFVWRVSPKVVTRWCEGTTRRQCMDAVAVVSDDEDDDEDNKRGDGLRCCRCRPLSSFPVSVSCTIARARHHHNSNSSGSGRRNGGCAVNHLSFCMAMLRLLVTSPCVRVPHATTFAEAALALLHSLCVCFVLPSEQQQQQQQQQQQRSEQSRRTMTTPCSVYNRVCALAQCDVLALAHDACAVYVRKHDSSPSMEETVYALLEALYTTSSTTAAAAAAAAAASWPPRSQEGSRSSSSCSRRGSDGRVRRTHAHAAQLLTRLLALPTSTVAGAHTMLLQLHLHQLLVDTTHTPSAATTMALTLSALDKDGDATDEAAACHTSLSLCDGDSNVPQRNMAAAATVDATTSAVYRLLAVLMAPMLRNASNNDNNDNNDMSSSSSGNNSHEDATSTMIVHVHVLHYLDQLVRNNNNDDDDDGSSSGSSSRLLHSRVCEVVALLLPIQHVPALVASIRRGTTQLVRAYADGDVYVCYHSTRRLLALSLQLLHAVLCSCADDVRDTAAAAAAAEAAAAHVLSSVLPWQLLTLLSDAATPTLLCRDAAAVIAKVLPMRTRGAVVVSAMPTATTTAAVLSSSWQQQQQQQHDASVTLSLSCMSPAAVTALARRLCTTLSACAHTRGNVVRLQLLCILHMYDADALVYLRDAADADNNNNNNKDKSKNEEGDARSGALITVLSRLALCDGNDNKAENVMDGSTRGPVGEAGAWWCRVAEERAAALELLRRLAVTDDAMLLLLLHSALANMAQCARRTDNTSTNGNDATQHDAAATAATAMMTATTLSASLLLAASAIEYVNAVAAAQLRGSDAEQQQQHAARGEVSAAVRSGIEQLLRDGSALLAHACDTLRVCYAYVHYVDATHDVLAPASSLSLSSLSFARGAAAAATAATRCVDTHTRNDSVATLAAALALLARLCAALTRTVWLTACHNSNSSTDAALADTSSSNKTSTLFVTRARALLLASLRSAHTACTATSAAAVLSSSRSQLLHAAVHLAYATAQVHSADGTTVLTLADDDTTTPTAMTPAARVQQLLVAIVTQLATSARVCADSHIDTDALVILSDTVQAACGVLRHMPDAVLHDAILQRPMWSMLMQMWQLVVLVDATSSSSKVDGSAAAMRATAATTAAAAAATAAAIAPTIFALGEHTLALVARTTICDAFTARQLLRACVQCALTQLSGVAVYAAATADARVTLVEQLFAVAQSIVLQHVEQRQARRQRQRDKGDNEGDGTDDVVAAAAAMHSMLPTATQLTALRALAIALGNCPAASTTTMSTTATGAVLAGQAAWHAVWCALLRLVEALVIADAHAHGDEYEHACTSDVAEASGDDSGAVRLRYTQLVRALLHDAQRLRYALGGFTPCVRASSSHGDDAAAATPSCAYARLDSPCAHDVTEMQHCTRLVVLVYVGASGGDGVGGGHGVLIDDKDEGMTLRASLIEQLRLGFCQVTRQGLLRRCLANADVSRHSTVHSPLCTGDAAEGRNSGNSSRRCASATGAVMTASATLHRQLLHSTVRIVHDQLVCLLAEQTMLQLHSLFTQERAHTSTASMYTPRGNGLTCASDRDRGAEHAVSSVTTYDALRHFVAHELHLVRCAGRHDKHKHMRTSAQLAQPRMSAPEGVEDVEGVDVASAGDDANLAALRADNVRLALSLFVRAAREQSTYVTLSGNSSGSGSNNTLYEREVHTTCGKMLTLLDAACNDDHMALATDHAWTALVRDLRVIRHELATIMSAL